MSYCGFIVCWWIYLDRDLLLVQKLAAVEFAAELVFVRYCLGVG